MQSNDARILRGAAIPTAAVGVGAVVIAGIVAGGKGALGAALGALVGTLFFAVGLYALGVVGKRWPELFLGSALLIYMTQIAALLIVLLVFRDATFMNGRSFGFAALACALVWPAAQTWMSMRVKTLYVEPESTSQGPGSTAEGERGA